MPLLRSGFEHIDIENTKDIAALHIEMDLCRSDRCLLAGCGELARSDVHRIGPHHIEGAVAQVGADTPRTRPPVSHKQRDDIIRLPRRYPNRYRLLDLAAVDLHRYQVGIDV